MVESNNQARNELCMLVGLLDKYALIQNLWYNIIHDYDSGDGYIICCLIIPGKYVCAAAHDAIFAGKYPLDDLQFFENATLVSGLELADDCYESPITKELINNLVSWGNDTEYA